MMGYGMMNWMTGNVWGWGLLGLITELLVIVVLALLAVYLWKLMQKK